MSSSITWTNNKCDGIRSILIKVDERDLADTIMSMDHIDRALMEECEKSPKLSDLLLGLQTLFFRMEQNAAKEKDEAK